MTNNTDSVLISFIIPHKGREELLEQTINSISGQDYDLNKIEVTVVTQNTELKSDILNSNSPLSIKAIYRPENETISTLRNTGVKHSIGEYFVFLDADMQLSPNWISCMLTELEENPGRAIISAVQHCQHNAPPVEKIRTALNSAASDCNVRFLPGCNLFLRKETFFAAGGFPDHLATCEDYYFTDKVHALGLLYCSSKASFIHLGEDKEYKQLEFEALAA